MSLYSQSRGRRPRAFRPWHVNRTQCEDMQMHSWECLFSLRHSAPIEMIDASLTDCFLRHLSGLCNDYADIFDIADP